MFSTENLHIFRHSVAFLAIASQENQKVLIPVATAFFISVPLFDTTGLIYLVTARHNIEEARARGKLFLRTNLDTGEFVDTEVPIDSWTEHPTTDVAVIPCAIPENAQYTALPSNWLIPKDKFRDVPLRDGSELFFAALFQLNPGRKQIQPLIRFGKIALMPYEPVLATIGRDTRGLVEAYLAECWAWGGCSGAPVVVDYPDFSRSGPDILSVLPFGLLGIISSHFDILRIGADFPQIPNNSGIAIVIPSFAILEVLEMEHLKTQREELRDRLLSNR